MKITPINDDQQLQVSRNTQGYIDRAGEIFDRRFSPIEILFDLTGKTAGMYKVKRGLRSIRYNPYIFAKYYEHNLENTVPHEVAHYIVDIMHGIRKTKPHGKEWADLMVNFGVKPERTCDYDMQGIPMRRFKTFSYSCRCNNYELTSRRHNQIVKNRKEYFCRKCHERLVASNAV